MEYSGSAIARQFQRIRRLGKFAVPFLVLYLTAICARAEGLYVPVKTGKFELKISEFAVLETRDSVTLASELPSNEAKIVSLLPEGSLVKKGDLIVEFDPAPFSDHVNKLEVELAETEAVAVQLGKEIMILSEQARAQEQSERLLLQSAKSRLKSLESAEGPLMLAQARYDARAAEVGVSSKQANFDSLTGMLSQGYVNQDEVDRAKNELEESIAKNRLKQEQYRLMRDVQIPAQIDQAKLDFEQKKRGVEIAIASSRYRRVSQEVVSIKTQNKIAGLRRKLDSARVMLDRTRIVSPVTGHLVYKDIVALGEQRKAQVGDSVWNRHGFIVIPDMSSMIAVLKIRERDIGKISIHQTATVFPEAYPGVLLDGRVNSVGTVVTSAGVSLDDQSPEFDVHVLLDSVDPRPETGNDRSR